MSLRHDICHSDAMFTYSLSLSPSASIPKTGQERPPSDTSFQTTLTDAQAAQQTQGTFGTRDIDPVDEENALRELFHILASLSVGIVDYSLLNNRNSASRANAGPMRNEVETLKEVIRRVLRRGLDDSSQEIDPKTGLPKASGTGSSQASLSALLSSLPDGIRNLLRRAFPDLDKMLQEELEKSAALGGRSAPSLARS